MIIFLVASGVTNWEDSMTIGQGFQMAGLGMCVVFLALISIIIIIKLLSAVVAAMSKKSNTPVMSATAPTPTSPVIPAGFVPAPGSVGELALYDTDEKDAALIMAIVANELNAPLNELRFISIRAKQPEETEVK